ncbi:KTSC domain-containing protein [Endozoicomonas sp. 4G]|uniref:KTSC domain-containing protein n=1 Tax=Endozoicomonas sp. 4G TaxID=2872754 RepID=UPI002078E128|nr:KTSC domain-containing protein [Endozoicomonas sp. 4G]
MKNYLMMLFLLAASMANASECRVSSPELALYYGNGMFNSQKAARESRNSLIRLLRSQLPGYRVSYKLSYNYNENPVDQMLEVARQKLLQDYSNILLWLAGIESAPDWFREGLELVVTSYDAFSYVFDSDLRRHVRQYSQDISQCRKVLLVAHSQGNFYGNESWRLVYQASTAGIAWNELKLMGVVSVATPASQVGYPLSYPADQQSVTRYLTLSDDLVINVLRSAAFGPLPANVTNTTVSDDWKNHSFVMSYLSGDPSGQMLREQIRSVAYSLETLPFDRQSLGSSALASAGYDPTAQILEIQFVESDSLYRYYDVPESVYQDLMSAESAGRYYNLAIRGQYPSRRLN